MSSRALTRFTACCSADSARRGRRYHKIENPKMPLSNPESRTRNPRSFTVLGVGVDWSLGLDLKILAKTIPAVLKGAGAA